MTLQRLGPQPEGHRLAEGVGAGGEAEPAATVEGERLVGEPGLADSRLTKDEDAPELAAGMAQFRLQDTDLALPPHEPWSSGLVQGGSRHAVRLPQVSVATPTR